MTKRLRQEDGIALVMALGITVVLIIFVASMISFTSENSRNANVSGSRVTAQSLAEAGIASAASIINKASNASDPTLLGCTAAPGGVNSTTPCTDVAVSMIGGTAYVHGLYAQTGNTGTWTLVAYGDVRNPAGGSTDLKKQMTASVTITGGGQSNNISVWNYVYLTGANGAGCDVDLQGTNVVVDVPLYVTGDLCLSGTNSSIVENTATGGQAVDVRVGGTLTMSGNNTTVGTAAHPLTSGLIQGGCTGGSPNPHTCTTADHWYVNATDTPITPTPPTTDYTTWYSNADPGPNHDCSAALSGTPLLSSTVFDNDTTMNGTAPSFDITGSTYKCVTSNGSISYSTSTHILNVSGTIFFDGNVTSSATNAMYHGTATIYINGTFALSGSNGSLRAGCPASPATPTHQCAFSTTSSEWNPNKDLILFIVKKTGVTAVDVSGTNQELQAGVLCDSTSTVDISGTNTQIEGPIICGKMRWFTNSKITPLPTISNLPPGAPVPPNAPATISQPVITGN